MAISLGTLLIELKAETAAFSSALDKAAQLSVNKSEDMKKAFSAAGVAISGALASAGGAIVEMVSHAAEAADHLVKLSQSAGVSVEALSSLGYAANSATSIWKRWGDHSRSCRSICSRLPTRAETARQRLNVSASR
jgi:hypothetical protein